MFSIQRGKGLALALLLTILTSFNVLATDVFFQVGTVFSVPSPYDTNRVFKMQALSPFAGNFFWRTSDVSGVFYVSNALATTYSGTMLAPPNSVTFSFYVSATNLGVVPAQGITSIPANGVQTYPAGQTAYSVQASDARYAPANSGPFGSLTAAQSTNLTASAIPTNFWNSSPGAWLTNIIGLGSINTNRYAPGTFLTATTNSGGLITLNVGNFTNGYTSITTSNPAVFADTNLVFVTSNSLASQIGSAGISALTATNISSNQVYSATNSIRIASGLAAYAPTNQFDAAGAALTATNGQGLASGLSAMVSTNRFDVSGAATAATNGIGVASGLSAFVSTNRFDTNNAASGYSLIVSNSLDVSKVNRTNGFSTNQFVNFATLNNPSITNGILKTYTNGSFTDSGGSLQDVTIHAVTHADSGGLIENFDGEQQFSHADSGAEVHGVKAHGDSGGFTDAEQSHADSAGSVGSTGFQAHANSGATASGTNSFAAAIGDSEGTASISGIYAQANGSNSMAFGIGAVTIAGNSFIWVGDNQNYQNLTNGSFEIHAAGDIKLLGAPIIGNGAGITNTSATNLTGGALAQVTNIINAFPAGNALTNAYGTNAAIVSVANHSVYIPTNFDASGGSNFLFSMAGTTSNFLQASKVSSTNGFSTGQVTTNLDIQGDIGFGKSGQSTNIWGASTNFVAFNNAGTSFTTNGALVWNNTYGLYTNWLNGSTLTNNGSAWLYETNGTTLYSLSGSSPIGTYSAVNGSLPAPYAVYTAAINDHMVFLGYWSISNQNQLMTNIFIAVGSNYIANNNGIGTNTTTFTPGGVINHQYFDSAAWGNSNAISGSGNGALVLAGRSNNIALTGGAIIGGGFGNSISSFGQNNDGIFNGSSNFVGTANNSTIVGGFHNHIPTGQSSVISGGWTNVTVGSFSSIGGGLQNLIQSEAGTIVGGESNSILGAASIASTILGGKSNSINSASYSTAGGRNVIINSNSVWGWSDGQQYIPLTNSFVGFAATNGFGINTNWAGTNALEVHGWVDSDVGFSILGVPVTAGGGGGVSSVNAAQQGFTSSGAITSSGTITLTRTADIDNLGFGSTNMGFLKVTNSVSIGGQVTMSALVLTNGFTNQSLTASTLLQSDANKKEASLANAAGILTNGGTAFGYNPNPAFDAKNVTNLLHSATVTVAGGGSVALSQNTDGSTNYAITVAGGSGIVLPANALGVLTNNGSGFTNWSSNLPGTWIAAGTLPSTVTDTSWMPITNAVAYTNGPPTPGQALVVAGAGTNSFGAVLVKGTNWPTGGGSAFPLAADGDANQFGITNLTYLYWLTNASGTKLSFQIAPDFTQSLPTLKLTPAGQSTYAGFKANYLYIEGNGFGGSYQAAIIVTNSGVTTIITSNNITTGSGIFNGGAVSVIPTNAAPVTSILSASGISLPIGITNVFSGRAQPIVQYYVVDAVTGTPILTMSNETSGVKVKISYGALALVETNFAVLPITTTNSIWRLRDESAGSGASVGVLTNWLNGL